MSRMNRNFLAAGRVMILLVAFVGAGVARAQDGAGGGGGEGALTMEFHEDGSTGSVDGTHTGSSDLEEYAAVLVGGDTAETGGTQNNGGEAVSEAEANAIASEYGVETYEDELEAEAAAGGAGYGTPSNINPCAFQSVETLGTDQGVLVYDYDVAIGVNLGRVQGRPLQIATGVMDTFNAIDNMFSTFFGASLSELPGVPQAFQEMNKQAAADTKQARIPVIYANLWDPAGTVSTVLVDGGKGVRTNGMSQTDLQMNTLGRQQFLSWLNVNEGVTPVQAIKYSTPALERREWLLRIVGIFDQVKEVDPAIQQQIKLIYESSKNTAESMWYGELESWKERCEEIDEANAENGTDIPHPKFDYYNGFRADIWLAYTYEGYYLHAPIKAVLPPTGGLPSGVTTGSEDGGTMVMPTPGSPGVGTGVAIQCHLTGGTVVSKLDFNGEKLSDKHFLGNFGQYSEGGISPGVAVEGTLIRLGESDISTTKLTHPITHKVFHRPVFSPASLPQSDGFASPASVLHVRN